VQDNNCDGVDNEDQVCCDDDRLTANFTLDDKELMKSKYYTLPDKVRDYTWTGTECDYTDYFDVCEGEEVNPGLTMYVREYYNVSTTIGSEQHTCDLECKGQTESEINFKQRALTQMTYKGGCSAQVHDGVTVGACTNETIQEECGEGDVLTEYYCEGNQLKSITKDCDDYDGYYEVDGERGYVDYSCQGGECRHSSPFTDNGLAQGQVRVILKNMGTVPFNGDLQISVNNFCQGQPDIVITDSIDNLGLHEYFEKQPGDGEVVYDFISACVPVDYTFYCTNTPKYGTTCQFWPGEGCGVFTHSVTEFESCETCCGEETTELDGCYDYYCDDLTTIITLSVNGDLGFSTSVTNDKASWCCR
jgi:hypothetical protein